MQPADLPPPAGVFKIMPAKTATTASTHPNRYFVKELAGEDPPSFAVLQNLYELASHLYARHPWDLLDESHLILLRSSSGDELCYCSVMGALGQVYAMHAYIGSESFRTFRKMEAGELTEVGEVFASQHTVCLEFVSRTELEKPDRDLLAGLGHPRSRNAKCPIFRAIRPGFYPWFVTAEEAQILTECIRAVLVVCSAVALGSGARFWDEEQGIYPMVSLAFSGKSEYQIEPTKAALPPDASAPVQLEDEVLNRLRGQDCAVRGVMELDHMFSAAAIGGRNERKACTCVALAVDADTGILYAPELTSASVPPADAMAQVFVKAVQSTRIFPREVHVRHAAFQNQLAPLLQSFGVAVRVQRKLPAMDQARAELDRFFS